MSGGHFDYNQHVVEREADRLKDYVEFCLSGKEDEWGWKPELSPETLDKLKLCEATLRRAAAMLHRVDWLISGDDGEESFHRRWREDISE